jgi:CRISPR-associated protein Cmr6
LEAAISLHHSYGVPVLPGSALKGLTRAYALWQGMGKEDDIFHTLFGREPKGREREVWEGGDAGYLIFHDAWWIPGSAASPLAPEVVTVHHANYYTSKGQKPATDFDSPTPNSQVAIQGSFLFAIEGLDGWADLGLKLLTEALQHWGAGAKTAAGYGYFVHDERVNARLQEEIKQIRLRDKPTEERLRSELANWNDDKLAENLGKRWNKVCEELTREFADAWKQFSHILTEVHGDKLRRWKDSPKENQRKAFNRFNRLTAGED